MKLLSALLFSVVVLFSTGTYASHAGQYKKMDGVAVYLVIMPAEMLQGHPKEHPESTMHLQGRIEGKHQHHIAVSVFDGKSRKVLQGAVIKAQVLAADFSGPDKHLELMIMGNTKSYGNFFNVPLHGSYRVELEIKIPGKDKPVNVSFQYANA